MTGIETIFGPEQSLPQKVSIPWVIDTHGHPRSSIIDNPNDGRAEAIIPYFARINEHTIGIGNTAPAVLTHGQASVQKARWNSLVPFSVRERRRIHVAPLLTEETDSGQVVSSYEYGDAIAMKMFMRAVSNANGHDVDNLEHIIGCVRAMNDMQLLTRKKKPMVLKVHAERKYKVSGDRILFLDREEESLARDITALLRAVPEAHVEICHLSSRFGVEYVRHMAFQGYNITAEIAPHYTQYTVDDLFEDLAGGTALNTHRFCLPIFKTEKDRRAVEEAMLSGEPWWHFGSDAACHIDDPSRNGGVKTNHQGITLGGQTQIPEAVVAYVVEKFARANKVDLLPAFLSENARALYDLPTTTTNSAEFILRPWRVPMTLRHRFSEPSELIEMKVAMGGTALQYQLANPPFKIERLDDDAYTMGI